MDAIHQTQVTGPIKRNTTPAPRAPEAASDEIHLISMIDATEPMIEPHATMDVKHFEDVKSIAGNKMTGDLMIDRAVMEPKKKIISGAINTAILLAPLATGIGVGLCAGGGLLGAVAAVYVGWRGTKALAKNGFLQKGLGAIMSALYEKKMAEPMWSGRRTYELTASTTKAFDSKVVTQGPMPAVRNPDDISKFFADNMKKYPSGTTVVHMVGHGLGYRYAAGLPFPAYEKVLQDATTQAGKAVDVMLLESCLVGNLESLAATYPYSRYTVCSEETITAHTVGEMLKNTVLATQGQSLTPKQFASAIVDNAVPTQQTMMMAAMQSANNPSAAKSAIEQAAAQKGPETLIVVDNEKMPALVQAVDKLGTLLADEVKDGRTAGIADAVKGTPKYPKPGLYEGMREKLAIGDLKAFSDRVWKIYGGGQVETPNGKFGPIKRVKVQQYAEEMKSPRAKDVMDAAEAVKKAMDDAIVNKHTSEGYRDSSGMSIQLPGKKLSKLENSPHFNQSGMAKFHDSAAPAGWQSFVDAMSPKMK